MVHNMCMTQQREKSNARITSSKQDKLRARDRDRECQLSVGQLADDTNIKCKQLFLVDGIQCNNTEHTAWAPVACINRCVSCRAPKAPAGDSAALALTLSKFYDADVAISFTGAGLLGTLYGQHCCLFSHGFDLVHFKFLEGRQCLFQQLLKAHLGDGDGENLSPLHNWCS